MPLIKSLLRVTGFLLDAGLLFLFLRLPACVEDGLSALPRLMLDGRQACSMVAARAGSPGS